MDLAEAFPEIVKRREPLAPYTHLRIGGPAEFFVQPRTVEELSGVLKFCKQNGVSLNMLGGGYNLLVRDDPVAGAVMRLAGSPFDFVTVAGTTVCAAGGTPLYDLISKSVEAGLCGLETLVGLRGSVGGSVRCNVGDRSGEIGSCVRRVTVLTEEGVEEVRTADELNFGDHSSDLDEPVILSVEFELYKDSVDALLKRMRRAWIFRKGAEPYSFQSAVRMFRNPTGMSAESLIDRAGLSGTKVGGAEVSDRNANYVIAHPGTTARDILKLLDLVRTRVQDRTGVVLQQELHVL